MKLGYFILGWLIGEFLWAGVSVYREAHKFVPSFAGTICDEVWNRTRTTEPTERWYAVCIHEVAIAEQKRKA